MFYIKYGSIHSSNCVNTQNFGVFVADGCHCVGNLYENERS